MHELATRKVSEQSKSKYMEVMETNDGHLFLVRN